MANSEYLNFDNAQRLGRIVIFNDTSRPIKTLHERDFWVENHVLGTELKIDNAPFNGNQIVVNRGLNKEGELFYWNCKMAPVIGDTTREFLQDVVMVSSLTPAKSKEISNKLEANLPYVTFNKEDDDISVVLPDGACLTINDRTIEKVDRYGRITVPRSEENNGSMYEVVNLGLTPDDFFGGIVNVPNCHINATVRVPRLAEVQWKKKLHEKIQNGSFTPDLIRQFVNISFMIEEGNESHV